MLVEDPERNTKVSSLLSSLLNDTISMKVKPRRAHHNHYSQLAASFGDKRRKAAEVAARALLGKPACSSNDKEPEWFQEAMDKVMIIFVIYKLIIPLLAHSRCNTSCSSRT